MYTPDPQANFFVLYLNQQTFTGTAGEHLANELRYVLSCSRAEHAHAHAPRIVMLHEQDPERGGCGFDRFLHTCARRPPPAARARMNCVHARRSVRDRVAPVRDGSCDGCARWLRDGRTPVDLVLGGLYGPLALPIFSGEHAALSYAEALKQMGLKSRLNPRRDGAFIETSATRTQRGLVEDSYSDGRSARLSKRR